MTDYRDTVGKKKDRQTGISLGGVVDSAQDAVDDATDAAGDVVDDATDAADDFGSSVGDVTDDALDPVSSIGDSAGDAFDDATDAADDFGSSVGDAVDDAQDTVDDAIDDAGSSFDDATDSIGDTVDDAIDSGQDAASGIGDTVDDAIDDAGDAIDDTTDNIGDTVDDAFGGAGDAFDNATDNIDDTFSDISGEIDDSIDDAIGSVGDAADNVTDDAFNPPDIGNLIPDVQAPDVGEVIDNASGEVNEAFDDATDFGGDVAEGAGNIFDDATEGAGDAFDEATDAAGDFGEGAVDFGSDLFGGAGEAADDAGDAVTDFLGGAADFGGDIAGGAGDIAGDLAEGGANIAGSAAGVGLDVVDAAADTVLFTPFNIGQEFGEQAAETLSNIGGGGVVEDRGDTTTAIGGSSGEGSGSPNNTPVQWGEMVKATTVTGAVIFKNEALNTPDERVRYFAIGEDKEGNKVAYGGNNKAVRITSVESLGQLPHFDTLQAAKEAVPHRGGRNNERNQSETAWQSPEKVNQIGAVSILQQVGEDSSDGQVTRFMAATQTDTGQKVFLESATSLVRVNNIDTLDDAPTFETQTEAEDVADQYMRTLQNNGSGDTTTDESPRADESGEQQQGSTQWGQAEQVNQVQGIIIIRQDGQTPQGQMVERFLAVTQDDNGNNIVIRNGNEAVRASNLQGSEGIPSFDTQGAAESAAQAYAETPPEEQETTEAPEPQAPEGQTSQGLGLPFDISPTALGIGALAAGGGLLAIFGGGGNGTNRQTSSASEMDNMENMRVRANTNSGNNNRRS